jgi:putative flavoprotein involved in K+ transport
MRFADEASTNVKRFIDGYIERSGLDCSAAEDDPAETVQASLANPPIRSIDWSAHNLRSIIWCTGFVGDFRWIEISGVLDEAGQPLHDEGLSALPGLYFAGLDFASTRKSGIIPGVAEDCARLMEHLVARAAA